MGFKEQAKKDLNAIFNLNEFAETKKVDGVEMVVIFEEPMDSTAEGESKYASPSQLKYTLFLLYSDEIWSKYRVKGSILIGNQDFIIDNKSKEFGLIKFQLERRKDY